ncbi:MAG: hypothetical protein VX100_07310 [Pseudomonadota bacterium]|nr:hypothetical protein [Pseudomonadota bacterium]
MTIKDQDPSKNSLIPAEEQQQLVAKVESLASQIQLVIPQTKEETWQEVVRLEEQAVVNAAKRGLLLLTLKEHSESDEFRERFKELGLSRSSAYEAMSIAKMFMALPESKVRTFGLLNMGKTQLTQLATLPIETLESLDDDEFEALGDMSVRELKKEVKRLRSDNLSLDEERAHAINELENERQRIVGDKRFNFPRFISQMRSDAIAYTGLLDEALSQSGQQVTHLVETREADFDARLAAAQTIHHTWASIYMQIGHMLERIHGEFGDKVQGIENLPRFEHAEWDYVTSERERMLESFKAFLN